MRSPEITHLQFQILGILMSAEHSGQYVRGELQKQGTSKSGPGFYQLMSRLEDSGFVRGRYQQRVIEGQVIKERRYKLTGNGVRAWEATRDSYMEQASLVSQGGQAGV